MCDKTQYMRPNKEEEWSIGIVIINLHGEVFDVVGITKKKSMKQKKKWDRMKYRNRCEWEEP